MKPFIESIMYLESLSEKEKPENYNKISIGILTDVKSTIGKLITNLQKMDN